jgi:hypothetical protein
MALTDTAIRNAKPRAKPYKLSDGGGLYLQVQPSGGKLWRQKYRVDGREKKLSIGPYPEIGLSAAREQLFMGKDPSREKQRDRLRAQSLAACTFSRVAAEYCERRKRDGHKPWAPATAARSEYLLSLLDAPIGRLPITEIEPVDILAGVRRIERKGNLESARRTLQLAGAVFAMRWPRPAWHQILQGIFAVPWLHPLSPTMPRSPSRAELANCSAQSTPTKALVLPNRRFR